MTFSTVWELLLHYRKTAVSAVLACIALSIAFCFTASRYEATATVTVSDPSGNVSAVNLMAVANNIALEEVAPYSSSDSKVDASVQIGTATAAQTLSITIESSDPSECLQIANEIGSTTVDRAQSVFESLQEANEAGLADLSVLSNAEELSAVLSGSLIQDSLGTDRTFEFCSFLLNDAVKPERAGFGTAFLLAAGLLLGILLAIVVVIIADAVKSPIRNREDAEEISGRPILFSGSINELGERLWANVQFGFSGEIESICLLPLSAGYVDECADSLIRAIEETPSDSHLAKADVIPAVSACSPMADGVASAYCARSSTVTVLCARQWSDSRKVLASTVEELGLAHANVMGVVLLRA